MDLIHRLRAWSHARQRLAAPARSPLEALAAVVAVYATHPTCPLALAARTRSLSANAYRRIDRERRALRIPAMRRTLFLVPRAQAARVFTAVRQSPAQSLSSLRRHDLPVGEYERIAGRVLGAAREPTEARDLQRAAGLAGDALATVLRCLRYEGRLLALAGDSLMSSPHRYVATSAWAPEGLDAGDRTDALSWLAREYLRAYGPARVEDFAWWAGVSKAAAARAIAPHETVDVGDALLLPAGDEAAFSRVKRVSGSVHVLPKWDAYTMGHAPDGRQRFVHPDVQHRVYTPIGVGLAGDGNPVVLVDGEAAGVWSYTLKEGFRLEPFDAFGPTTRRRVEERFDAVGRLLRG